MKNTKKIMAALLSLAMVSALAPMSVFAETKDTDVTLTKAPTDDALYYVTIPPTLTVENSGWNALGTGIKVEKAPKEGSTTEYLDFTPSKKVTVSAASTNSWKLTSTESAKTVGYTLKSASADAAAVTTWDFLANEITQDGTTKTAGIDVNADDYDAAPAGTYTDKITFTIAVEDDVRTLTIQGYTSPPFVVDDMTVEYINGQTWDDMVQKYGSLSKGNHSTLKDYVYCSTASGSTSLYVGGQNQYYGGTIVHASDTIDGSQSYFWEEK